MKKVLFFDIDGTIVSDITRKIPNSTCVALKRAKEKGHLLFVNTGRTMCRIVPEVKALPFDGYLCGCGIYLTYNNEVLFEKRISKDLMKRIVQMASECNVDGVFEGIENIYYFKGTSRFEELEVLKDRYIEEGLGYNNYVENGDYIFAKIFVCTDDKSDRKRFLEFISKEMDVIDRGHGTYECGPKGCSKATAMEMIYKKFGIDRSEAYVFGDGSNDIPMFEVAAHTIAMGKHSEMLTPYAEFITKTVEDDGIEFAMRHYGLI